MYSDDKPSESELKARGRLLKRSFPLILLTTIVFVFGPPYLIPVPNQGVIVLSLFLYLFIVFRIFMYYIKH